MVLQEEELVWWLWLKSPVTSASLILDPVGTLGLPAQVPGKFVSARVATQRGRRSQQRGHLHHLQPDNHSSQMVFDERLKNCCNLYLLNITIRCWLSKVWAFIFTLAVVGKLLLRAILVDLLKLMCDFPSRTSMIHTIICHHLYLIQMIC